ncbi:putative ATP-binding protein involved in virulence [Pseudomonas poae]|uniref:Putative ATP-binding protein involved in virulence n=1 Tax=Pseudomonas poae TaxID=200451 RepID=A0A7Z1GLJ3_9PSED|nr:AAA family ATPase [Pseudomonas poae]PFG60078.1 putative ATP-binding protein involved in virulence [Pseudomonas poae]
MRLDQLHIQNFRCYEDATFDFQPGFNLVVGVNGSGKTSLLQAVAASLYSFSSSLGGAALQISNQDARFEIQEFEGRYRFERIYPVTLDAVGSAFGRAAWNESLVREGQLKVFDIPVLNSSIDILNPSSKKIVDLPLMAFYRADRRWNSSDISVEFAARQQPSRLDAYKDWFDASANLETFESWLIGKTLERLQKMSRSTASPKFNDELQLINSALTHALPDAKGIEYDLGIRSLLVHFENNRSLTFNSLSDGQRGMLAMVSDIARRMCLLNPHLKNKVLEETTGIVIIDELDIHLHPGWQRTIASTLKKLFPKIQFIAASHSPQIIGSLRPGEVILLTNEPPSHPRVTYGLDSSRILEEVMGVSEREPKVEVLLSELFSTIEDNELEKAKTQLQALKKLAPDLPEFAGAQALIRRKEILGK